MAQAMTMTQAIDFTHKMVKGVSYKKPLKVCQHIMLSGVRKCFSQGASPDGKAWRALKAKRRRGAKARARILRDTGRLMASTAANNAPGAIRKLTDRSAAIGSNLIYAATHQYGDSSRNIPARPFIGHRKENLVKYDKVFAEFEENRARRT